jgi:cobalt-zinc-cadmium efflux system outer membrane protein
MLAAFLTAVVAVAQPPVGDSLTLEQALAHAQATRPQVALATAGVDRARGAKRVAGAIPNPNAQLETDNIAPTRKMTVVQPLAWLPGYVATRAAGSAGVDRAVADSMQLVADVGREVRRAFFGALAADERLRLLTEQAGLADSLVVLAARRVSAGDISALERDQVAQEASRARLVASQARLAARVARVELSRAIAFTSAAPPRAAGPLGDGLDVVARLDTTAEANERPALRAALADSAAAAARLLAARLSQIPVPSLIVGREWGEIAPLRSTVLGLSMPLPLWSQGRERVAEARGIARESAARVAEVRLTNGALIDGARMRVVETAERARFARDSLLPDARRIRAGAVRLYEAGRTGMLPVFDALRAERDVAQTVVQELLAFQEARADLAAALGQWR